MQAKLDVVNIFLVSNGYKPLNRNNKPFSAMWYLSVVKLAKVKLRATIDMVSEVPIDDTALFSSYAYVLKRQTIRYQFTLSRAYAAFSREAFTKNRK